MAKKPTKTKEHNRVTNKTSFSKAFTALLFIFLPIIAFLMGINYQKELNKQTMILQQSNQLRNINVKSYSPDASTGAMMNEGTPAAGTKSAQ